MYTDRSRYPFPNVVITDLRMENESGIEFVEWLRKQDAPVGNLRVVILTGSASEPQWQAAKKVGAPRVYRKPTKLEDLEQLLAFIAAEFCEESPPPQ